MTLASAKNSGANDWNSAFPGGEASRAVSFLSEIWEELSTAKPEKFNPRYRENTHTEFLHCYLDMHSVSRGRLTGRWINEEPHAILDDPLSDCPIVIKRIRKDVTYFSNANNVHLTLVFEFKKLSPNRRSWATYAGEEGMGRFVGGEYSKNEPVAVMVGMVIGDNFETVNGLQEKLSGSAMVGALKMIAQHNGVAVSSPSKIFPKNAIFDTEHFRTPDKAPAGGVSIRLAHLFLQMPSV